MNLDINEKSRFSRHLLLEGFGEAAQLKLKQARILIAGVGGLGCPALQYLCAAGVGTIGIVDDDTVSESNLQRQILFNTNDCGKLKVDVAEGRMHALNPFVQIEKHAQRIGIHNVLELVNAYDLVIDGTDNFQTRYLLNDACVMSGKALVYGSVLRFEGQVSVFNYQDGPTYR